MNYFSTLRDVAIVIALLVVPFLFLRSHLKDPSDLSLLDRGILRVSGPIQYVAQWAADTTSGLVEDYVYLVDVRQDNDRLRADLWPLVTAPSLAAAGSATTDRSSRAA